MEEFATQAFLNEISSLIYCHASKMCELESDKSASFPTRTDLAI